MRLVGCAGHVAITRDQSQPYTRRSSGPSHDRRGAAESAKPARAGHQGGAGRAQPAKPASPDGGVGIPSEKRSTRGQSRRRMQGFRRVAVKGCVELPEVGGLHHRYVREAARFRLGWVVGRHGSGMGRSRPATGWHREGRANACPGSASVLCWSCVWVSRLMGGVRSVGCPGSIGWAPAAESSDQHASGLRVSWLIPHAARRAGRGRWITYGYQAEELALDCRKPIGRSSTRGGLSCAPAGNANGAG
jgi:hypothetical protein